MRISIDVVIANCTMSLAELTRLQDSQLKPVNDFIQSEVLLKSGNQLIATGILVKVDNQFYVSIDQVNTLVNESSQGARMSERFSLESSDMKTTI